jgi:FkbM family methyltransferase
MYARAFSRPALVPLHRALFKISVSGLGVLNHYDLHASGEFGFLRGALAGRSSPLVLDVGAHRGEYAKVVLAINPNSRVHSFEPHPLSFRSLRDVPGLAGTYELAVSAKSGTMRLYDGIDRAGSQLATLVPGAFEELYARESNAIDVLVTSLDEFAERHHIDRVDLLKIDVEGHELEVLRGARRLLEQRRIDLIQFEFGSQQLLTDGSLHKFEHLLSDYSLHRLLATGSVSLASLRPYERELFAFQNIVAKLNVR